MGHPQIWCVVRMMCSYRVVPRNWWVTLGPETCTSKQSLKKKINSHWYSTIINHFSCWPALRCYSNNSHQMAAEIHTWDTYQWLGQMVCMIFMYKMITVLIFLTSSVKIYLKYILLSSLVKQAATNKANCKWFWAHLQLLKTWVYYTI